MTTTPILGITEVAQSQSSKEVTINNATLALEQAMNQALTTAVTGTTNMSNANAAQNMVFKFTGTAGAQTVNFPARKRFMWINNATNGVLSVRVTGAVGAAVAIAAGTAGFLYTDGTDFFSMANSVTAVAASAVTYTPASPLASTNVDAALDELAGFLALDPAFFLVGDGTDENRRVTYVVTRAFSLPASLTGSATYAETVGVTSPTDFDVQKNNSSIGTISFAAASHTATFTFASGVSFAAGDRLALVAPAALHSLAGISITLKGARV